MIYWIYGNSHSGKTTLAEHLRRGFDYEGIHLDGDVMRAVWCDMGLTRTDRETHNLRIARLARTLEKQGFTVIVSTICPYKELREHITAICNPRWIYLEGGEPASDVYPFEPPIIESTSVNAVSSSEFLERDF